MTSQGISIQGVYIEKGYKCGSGAVLTENPQGLFKKCNECEKCTAQKGILVETGDCFRFISEEGIKNLLSDD